MTGKLGPEEIWERPDMRAALARRDIAEVYRILQKYGIPQRKIAAAVEQSQSEISEILGGRRVVSYDVLLRIAEGLGVPRGWMGMSFTDIQEAERKAIEENGGEFPSL